MFSKKVLLLSCTILIQGCLHQRRIIEARVNDIVETEVSKDAKIPEKRFDAELDPFLHEFYAEALKRGVVITQPARDLLVQVKYVDSLSTKGESDVIAVCSRYYSFREGLTERKKVRWNTIEVLRKESQHYSGGKRELLREVLFHEFIHCLMNKGHLPPEYPGIMSPRLNPISRRVFDNWEGLLDEAFSPEYLRIIPDT